MKINPITNSIYSFGSNQTTASETDKQQNFNNMNVKDNNPISKVGEKSKLIKFTFFGGLVLGAQLLFELMDGDFIIDELTDSAERIVNKQHKNASGGKKILLTLGASAGLLAMFVSGFALLYTMYEAPKINYNGNINTFKKKKDMDVYIKSNDTEKELYTQMNDKAKNATSEEKAKLKEQYTQMQMAKNQIPDFVKGL